MKLDFRHFPDGYVVTAADVEAELARIGHTAQAARHRRRQHLGWRPLRPARLCADGLRHGPRSHPLSDLARRTDHRHRRLVLGRALRPHRKKYAETKNAELIWEGHKSGPRDRLLPYREAAQPGGAARNGFKVACFPVKIKRPPRAGPARWPSSMNNHMGEFAGDGSAQLRIRACADPHSSGAGCNCHCPGDMCGAPAR